MSNNKKISGFTLIELLVVISIIGFLAAASLVLLNNGRIKARDAKRKGDLNQIQTAIEMYYQENGTYPTCAGGSEVCSTTGYAADMRNLAVVPTYLAKMPIDPTNINTLYGYYYARGYKKTGTYSFIYTTSPGDYLLATRFEGISGIFGAWNNSYLNILLGN